MLVKAPPLVLCFRADWFCTAIHLAQQHQDHLICRVLYVKTHTEIKQNLFPDVVVLV